ncbi:ribonuclease [Actinobacillus succinogenes]|uniref:Ribonuclease T2 n=1 Tax=Actinobacillus succinogenes (strain ATCC 55618 / DSM 22257 / CCUG 43843 / 130Z) TaxID=339671 RepID=A6VLR2_ACTSZ|nr:ribonuclease T(2) [Actinobacillus succinogenes]ABR73909.1 ribonuclease T2 [Actinobacillus succinogenes 130Z]PHI39643.1 ribonuclease [Actinobacillus succinogenes]
MNQKYLKWIRIGAVALLAAYFYFSQRLIPNETTPENLPQQQQKQDKTRQKTQSAVRKNDVFSAADSIDSNDATTNRRQTDTRKQANVSADYDYNMRDDAIGQNAHAPVDYYMLVLSWSPAFCDSQTKKFGGNLPPSVQQQCGMQRQYGWVIHGLWPQNRAARGTADHPRFCRGDLPPVDSRVIEKYLSDSPSAVLLQGEWEKHGACAFQSADAYFQKQRQLFRSLTLPTQNMDRKALFRWMKQHNPPLKNVFMQASRQELFICYDLNWNAINCPSR